MSRRNHKAMDIVTIIAMVICNLACLLFCIATANVFKEFGYTMIDGSLIIAFGFILCFFQDIFFVGSILIRKAISKKRNQKMVVDAANAK